MRGAVDTAKGREYASDDTPHESLCPLPGGMNVTLQPVILAGGSGTRLWPLSREFYPKQFLPLIGELTLFQETVLRLDGMEDVAEPLIVCNEAHRFLVTEQLRQLERTALGIIVEPVARNTAPALTLAALRLGELVGKSGADQVILVMPADHVLQEVDDFQNAVALGLSLAESDHIVTMGVVPDGPATGYGYIRKGEAIDGAYQVASFVEKPDLETATSYVDTGEYLWNSGIFLMRPSVWLSELEGSRPDIAAACRKAQFNGHVDGDFYRPGAADFVACPSDSIDYAVMEKVTGAVVVPLEAGWEDLGAWSALWAKRDHDSNGNVVQGDVYTDSTHNALLIAQHRLLATIGVEDMVVVETADAVLVARKDQVQDVKEVVERLKAAGRVESEHHRKVHRPWGTYEIVDAGEGYQVKQLTVNPGAALSLQMHHHRAEHWVVVNGTARVTRGDEVFALNENESTYVPHGVTHRLENAGQRPLEIIEVQSGSYLGEDDIVRLQDDYNRPPQD